MTKDEKKEITEVLLGHTVLADDGRITTLGPGFHLSAGIADGAGAVRFFGIADKSRCFKSEWGQKKVMAAALEAMGNIGRGVLLKEQPDTAACLIRYFTTRPVVLTFRYEDEVPVLTAWTGRGLTGWISIRRSMHAFADELPEEISISQRKHKEEIKE